MVMKRILIALLAFMTFAPFCKAAKEEKQSTTLIVMGQGKTLDEATKVALRSAIEQTFKVFVSSNTTVVNDAMTKDEIATVSSGNIDKYEYVSKNKNADGTYDVTLRAQVSVGKLLSFVKDANIPGVPANIDGAVFAMNVKLGLLYRQNELEALENMVTQLAGMAQQMIDPNYELAVSDPVSQDGKNYKIDLKVGIKYNTRAVEAYRDYFLQTIKALSLTKDQVNSLKALSIAPSRLIISYWNNMDPSPEFYLRNNPVVLANVFRKISIEFAVMRHIAKCVTISDGLKNYYTNMSGSSDDFMDCKLRPRTLIFTINNRAGSGGKYLDASLVEQYGIGSNNAPGIELPVLMPRPEEGDAEINNDRGLVNGDYFVVGEGSLNYTLDQLQQIKQLTIAPLKVSEKSISNYRTSCERNPYSTDWF